MYLFALDTTHVPYECESVHNKFFLKLEHKVHTRGSGTTGHLLTNSGLCSVAAFVLKCLCLKTTLNILNWACYFALYVFFKEKVCILQIYIFI